jgi:hypothetical protein
MKTMTLPGILILFLLGLCGCTWWQNEENQEFSYKDPEPPPLVQPEMVEPHEYLRQSPSGRLYPLQANQIAISSLPNFSISSDPRAYLRDQVRKAKEKGSSYLPFHYYIAPDGIVYEGQSVEYAGDIGGKRVSDAVLIGVMGNFDPPTQFMTKEQERTLVQLCAWVCSQHSIDPSQIVPARELSPQAPPLGTNLENWFGETDLLRERVRQTLQKDLNQKAKEKEGGFMSGIMGSKQERRPPDLNEDF